MSVRVCRPKLFKKNLCLSLVSGAPHFFLGLHSWHAGISGLVLSAPDSGVRGPRFEPFRGQLCLSRQPLQYAASGTGCALLLQCLDQLSLAPLGGRSIEYELWLG